MAYPAGSDSHCLAETSYDFYGVSVRLSSNSDQVLSSFDSVYHFFRQPEDLREPQDGRPYLELVVLVSGGPGRQRRRVFAQVPSGFDGWRTCLRNRIGPASAYFRIIFNIVEIPAPASQGEAGYHLYAISDIEDWFIDWTAGMEFLIFHFIMHHLPHLCVVHSGAVSRDGQGILLCGSPDSGKSVLSYALTRQGYRYLSDEYGLFAPASLQVFPFPRGISFKPEAAELFPELKAVLEGDGVVWRQEKRHLVSLQNLGFQVTREPARASFLFFVKHLPAAFPQLSEIAGPDAAERLLTRKNLWVVSPQENRNFSRNDAATILCSNARCYELLSGDIDKTVDLINSVVSQP